MGTYPSSHPYASRSNNKSVAGAVDWEKSSTIFKTLTLARQSFKQAFLTALFCRWCVLNSVLTQAFSRAATSCLSSATQIAHMIWIVNKHVAHLTGEKVIVFHPDKIFKVEKQRRGRRGQVTGLSNIHLLPPLSPCSIHDIQCAAAAFL